MTAADHPSHRNRSRSLPERPASGCAPRAAAVFARSPNASKSIRKRFASWGRKAHCFARWWPPQAQNGRFRNAPLLYRSGAQGRDRTTDTAIFSRMLYQLSYLGTSGREAAWERRFIVRLACPVHHASPLGFAWRGPAGQGYGLCANSPKTRRFFAQSAPSSSSLVAGMA
jgi:hypothetical protein